MPTCLLSIYCHLSLIMTWVLILYLNFFYFLTSWGLADPGERAPPRVSQLLQRANNSAKSMLFKGKSTNPELALQPPPPRLSHLGARCQMMGQPPGPKPIITQLFKLPYPPPQRPQYRLLSTFPPRSLCLLVNPGAGSRGPAWRGLPSPPEC